MTPLDKLMKARDVGNADVMKALSVSEDTVKRWRKGGGMPSATLEKLADFLDCTTDAILGRRAVK